MNDFTYDELMIIRQGLLQILTHLDEDELNGHESKKEIRKVELVYQKIIILQNTAK